MSGWVKKYLVWSKARGGEERYPAGYTTSENVLLPCVLQEQNLLIICLSMNSTSLTDMVMSALIFYTLPSVKTLVHFLQGNNSHLLVIPLYGHPLHCLKQFLRT